MEVRAVCQEEVGGGNVMAFADHVGKDLWEKRYAWLRETEEKEAGVWGSIVVSAHGTLVSYDVEIAFCAGAWLSVIVLSHAAIDATIRDTETGNYRENSKAAFGGDPDLEWLRLKRNRLVHARDPDASPEITEEDMGNLDTYHDSLENDARRAVTLLYRSIYANPGT